MITLQEIIDERKEAYDRCVKVLEDRIAVKVFPPLVRQLEEIKFLEGLRDKENGKITVACLTTNIMKDEDVDRLEKRLSEKFGNTVVCIPPTMRNIMFFDPESFIEQKFELRKGNTK